MVQIICRITNENTINYRKSYSSLNQPSEITYWFLQL